MNRLQTGPFVTRCRCGHERMSPSVQPIRRYGWWGMFCLIMGYTALPRRIDVICVDCGAVFDSISNRAMLERYRFDEPGPNVK